MMGQPPFLFLANERFGPTLNHPLRGPPFCSLTFPAGGRRRSCSSHCPRRCPGSSIRRWGCSCAERGLASCCGRATATISAAVHVVRLLHSDPRILRNACAAQDWQAEPGDGGCRRVGCIHRLGALLRCACSQPHPPRSERITQPAGCLRSPRGRFFSRSRSTRNAATRKVGVSGARISGMTAAWQRSAPDRARCLHPGLCNLSWQRDHWV